MADAIGLELFKKEDVLDFVIIERLDDLVEALLVEL